MSLSPTHSPDDGTRMVVLQNQIGMFELCQ